MMAITACDEVAKAADELLEKQAGCKEDQLGKYNEAALPSCSKAYSCCQFIQGECGETTIFDFPTEVAQACETNNSVLKAAIEEYQGIKEGECPSYLSEQACSGSVDDIKKNYVEVVDKGGPGGSDAAPSCKLIVDETIVPLNAALDDTAKYLPKACEAGTGNVSPDLDAVAE